MTSAPVEEVTVPANDVEIHIARMGDPASPPLLLIHGIYDRWESWMPVVDRFTRGYQLVIPDLRGHGRSSKPKSGYELADYAADMAGVLRALKMDRVFVAGHSLGALTSVYLAAEYPDYVRALVLEDPPAEFNEDVGSRMQPLLDAKRGSEEDAYKLFREINPNLGEERWRDQSR